MTLLTCVCACMHACIVHIITCVDIFACIRVCCYRWMCAASGKLKQNTTDTPVSKHQYQDYHRERSRGNPKQIRNKTIKYVFGIMTAASRITQKRGRFRKDLGASLGWTISTGSSTLWSLHFISSLTKASLQNDHRSVHNSSVDIVFLYLSLDAHIILGRRSSFILSTHFILLFSIHSSPPSDHPSASGQLSPLLLFTSPSCSHTPAV